MTELESSASLVQYLHELRETIAAAFASRDEQQPQVRKWNSDLGSGSSFVFEDGACQERAGINISQIAAASLPAAATAGRSELAGRAYRACGLSVIAHPKNPYAPTVHMNIRHFRTDDGSHWWFGGGMDLTPHYGFIEDCKHFHQTCRDCLDKFDSGLYPAFKKKCDDYFRLAHRGEQRGIGGIFFDDYASGSYAQSLAVASSVGNSFCDAYLPILDKRIKHPYGERERQHQLQRRARYVEFNLLYDRGTMFGLQSGGNADAILTSMPPLAAWGSKPDYEAGSPEERLAAEFLIVRDWI